MVPEMISLSAVQFRRIAAAFVLILTVGCQGPAGLDDRNREWIGTLPGRDTDFDRRTWQDTSANVVRQLMERLPDRIESLSEHRLARNLLISVADAPHGDEGSEEFLALRVDELMRLGNVGDAAALARAARDPPRDEASAQREIEAELLTGNVEMACIDLRALAARSSTRWVEDGLVLCKARAGEPGAMPPPDTDKLGALARIGGAPLPSNPPSGDPIGTRIAYRVAVGNDPKVSTARRLEAAFAAARASALGGEAYATILRSAPVSGQAALSGKPPASGEQAASLFQAIDRSADPRRKLALAERGLLSPDGAIDGVSAAMAEPLRTVKPEPALAALAARFAAYFYAVGDLKAATPWADLAKRSGLDTAVWPYRSLLRPPGSGELAEWEKRARLDPGRRERIVAILSAFGIVPPERFSEATDQASFEPSQNDVEEIDKAAAQRHVGETTLRALAIFGGRGPAGANPQTLHRVLEALDRVNLHDEARVLAFEAITATVLVRTSPPKGEVDASIMSASPRR
ncbi:MAG: hypothetical protein JWM91_1305 [Rhodospirillales bacterium]|nr:hypothetical protein [Rhodospirillales bacterium]